MYRTFRESTNLLASFHHKHVPMNQILSTKSPTHILATTGINGCTTFFVWTSSRLVKIITEEVTAVAIVAPDKGDLDIARERLRELNIPVEVKGYIYEYKKGDWNSEWEFEATLGTPGIVNEIRVR
ncbi:hypothetical protein G7Y89_g3906 [Cudoniella acicularis]|uniref:Uncharacterized protein n=1 Tax=Cudoniella acicularis TaxID=354080 RepID=A0A8H4RRA6_9HELO|nr:hypothetical protein G7Y89_g3906 [Cudoniella acicularis]